MAKKTRATFQKREKERARQQRQHDKAQRRLAVKAQRGSNGPARDDEPGASAGMSREPHAWPAREQEAQATD
jgi:hypothetical protein